MNENKPGAQPGNTNRIRHGLRCGKMPPDTKHIENRTLKLRRQLESAVLDSKGQVTLVDAATIQTAVKWERHSELCRHWLFKQADSLTPEQRLAFSRDAARASSERDKCLQRLGLDRQDGGLAPWATPAFLHGPEQTKTDQPDADPGPEKNRASEGVSGVSSEG